jgi:hypothetical protein
MASAAEQEKRQDVAQLEASVVSEAFVAPAVAFVIASVVVSVVATVALIFAAPEAL